MEYDLDLEQNVFVINNEKQPALALYEDSTYYFDLSDSQVYMVQRVYSIINLNFLKQSDGTHRSGTAYTDWSYKLLVQRLI